MDKDKQAHHSSKWLSPSSSKGKEKSTKSSGSPSQSRSHISKDGLSTEGVDSSRVDKVSNERGTLDSRREAAEKHRPVKPKFNEMLAISATNYQSMHEMIEQACYELKYDFGEIDSQPLQVGRYYPNQIYSITSIGPPRKEYTLRIPTNPVYFDDVNERLLVEEKLLRYLKDKLPMPEVIEIQYSRSNALSASFMIQSRIPGVPLNTVYEKMSVKEKQNIAIQIAELIPKIEGIQFPDAGELVLDYTYTNGLPGVRLFQADYERSCNSEDKQKEDGLDVKALMLSLLEGWREYTQMENQRFPPKGKSSEELSAQLLIYQRLKEMIEDMGQRGYFLDRGNPFVLALLGFPTKQHHSQEVYHSSKKWKITGLVDWDDIDVLPCILTRNPPTWLWESPNPVAETPFQEIRRRKLPQPPPYPGIPSPELSSVKSSFRRKNRRITSRLLLRCIWQR